MLNYVQQNSFLLPGPNTNGLFDELPDGRLVVWDGQNIQLETAPQSRTFALVGQLYPTAAPYPSFIRVCPDGIHVAVGDSTRVTWFLLSDLTQRASIDTGNNYDAEWVDNTKLAISGIENGASVVSVLDFGVGNAGTVTNVVVVSGINGASGGVTIDAAGNLYCANGWATVPAQTGDIKAFAPQLWKPAYLERLPLIFRPVAFWSPICCLRPRWALTVTAIYTSVEAMGNLPITVMPPLSAPPLWPRVWRAHRP